MFKMSQQFNCGKSCAQKKANKEFKRDRINWRKILAVLMFVVMELPNGLMAWMKLSDRVASLMQRKPGCELVQKAKNSQKLEQ